MPINEHDRDEIRRDIVAEVAKQLQPFSETLDAVHEWQLSFWSNGSGRLEKGLFQRRMEVDDARNDKVEDFIKTAQKRQLEAEILQKYKERRWKFWWPIIKWVGGGIATATATGVVSLVLWAGPRVRVLYENYLREHPTAQQQIKNMGAANAPAVQSQQKPQNADGIPTTITR